MFVWEPTASRLRKKNLEALDAKSVQQSSICLAAVPACRRYLRPRPSLTLALGIGGTTAIFTLIHAVMLRSLPVSDPALLYRIGDGDDCCVEGGPQDRWGMYLLSALRAPEGRSAGIRRGGRLSGRRRAFERAA